MLTKKLFQQVLSARGLTAEQIVQRTGIPAESLDVLIGREEQEGRDPGKLISQATFEKVLALLGIASDNSGLRAAGVLVWAYNAKAPKRQRAQWCEAVSNVREALMSDDIAIAELTTKNGFFAKKQYLMLVHDVQNNVFIGVVGLDKDARASLLRITGASVERSEALSEKEFVLHRKLMENGVYRRNYFTEMMVGRARTYGWTDVQAAAKEFHFSPEAIIDLMLAEVRRKEEEATGKVDDGVPVLTDPVQPFRRVV